MLHYAIENEQSCYTSAVSIEEIWLLMTLIMAISKQLKLAHVQVKRHDATDNSALFANFD